MRATAVILLSIGMLLCFWRGTNSYPEAERAAVEAAERWLLLVDREEYEESWDETASYFQGVISREQWQQSMQSVRKPLGNKLSRVVKSKMYNTSLPGAPDGEYVVIQFQTSFQHKKSAIETVTPMMDKDGKWQVSGYYIK